MKSLITSFAVAMTIAAPAAHATNAAPFGLEIGVATCEQGMAKLGTRTFASGDARDGMVESTNPGSLYPAASKIMVRCLDSLVAVLILEIPKGGVDNPAPREAFTMLSRKYKLTSGGPIPTVGDGYAIFKQDRSVIIQSVPHMSFSFKVGYMTQALSDAVDQRNAAEAQQRKNQKASSL